MAAFFGILGIISVVTKGGKCAKIDFYKKYPDGKEGKIKAPRDSSLFGATH